MRCICSKVKELTAPAPKSNGSFFRLLWKSATFQIVDGENIRKLRILSYYEPVLEYLVQLVSLLSELDSQSSNPCSTLPFLNKLWKNCLEDIIKARKNIEDTIHKEACCRSLVGALTYCSLGALGLFCFQGIGVALGGAALIFGCVYGPMKAYQMCRLPDTINACKVEGEKFDKLLDKIPVERLDQLCNDNH